VGKFGDRDLENAIRPYLPGMPALVPAFAALIRHEPPPSGSEPLRGDALHAVCVQLMRALAAERPTVWIVEDLQFADRDSRDLILSLARATEGHRILLLVTSRPGLPTEEMAHFSRLESLRRLVLGRLSPRETLDLLADALKSDALAEKLGGKIALKSDGVPFFVFEMIRGLEEGQFLQQTEAGIYVLTRVINDIEVPSAIKDLIDGRMKGLNERQRAILDVGAVQGMSFDPGLVAAVLEEKRMRVLRDIAEVERRFGLVRGEDTRIRFDQTQVQEVVYSALIPELRREYHAALADAYEGDDAYFRARHHLLGSRPKRGLEHVDAALDWLFAAYRNEAAFELTDLALNHLEGEERAKLLLRKCSHLRIVGRTPDASDAVAEAHELAASADDDALVLEVLAQRSAVAEAMGTLDKAETLAREWIEMASRTGDRILEARAQTRLGSVAYNRRRYADSLAHHQRAVAIYHELGDPAEERAVTSMGSALTALRRLPEALECQQRGLAAARGAGDRNREGGALGNLGNVHFYSGRLDEAEEHWEQAREIGAELGNRAFEATSIANIGESRALKGELAATLAAAQRVLELQSEIGAQGQICHALATLTTRNLQLGRIEQAKELAERADAIAQELGEPWVRQVLLRFAMIAAMEGDRAVAEQHFRGVLDRARAESDTGYTLASLLGLARLRIEGADALLSELAPVDEPEAQVLVPALLGRTDAARAAIEEHGALVGVIPRMEAYFLVGDIEEAHRLLRHMREYAPEECRDSMIERVPLYREIEEAWNARGMLNERRPAGPADPTDPGPASPES
ncbi:MAG: ATP-binding protein, partial [Planctomycetota bacterium]